LSFHYFLCTDFSRTKIFYGHKGKNSFRCGALFMHNGIKNISLDEVASKLGISKRTIYQHFEDKEDILVYFLKYTQKKQFEDLQNAKKKIAYGYRYLPLYIGSAP